MIGSRLAHYEITNHLGTGGMGEVYQATDSKLRRNVALKFLPEAFARDADRVARFEREARMLASLNDPHIAAIYGLEEFKDRQFLVMELAPGDTLAARIARGAIPVKEALAIGVQIAAALEAAHDNGVVHRDLKPANIKVTADGQVKVLDFGLAKAFAVEWTETKLSNAPTMSAATASGIILGTTAYMSPEQAKGLEVDRRTDIFAFGAVLFEMLTGRQAFRGDTMAETLARVIEREPDWNSLPQGIDPGIQSLLRRCLEKDPRRRRRDAADLRMEIEQALTTPDYAASLESAIAKRTPVFAWIAAAILAVALALTLAMPRFRVPLEAPQMRLEISTPPTSNQAAFTISPDGRHLVFIAAGDGPPRLWLRSLDSTTARPLAGTERANFPFWDPDSRSICFFADGRLKKIDISGGAPQTLADAGTGRGGTWGRDNVILFSPNLGSPIVRVPASGGKAVAVTKVAPGEDDRFPKFLPDGRQFVFYRSGDSAGMYLGSLDSMEVKRLAASDSYGAYAAGWLFSVRQGALIAQRFDLSRSELKDSPVVVADSLVSSTIGGGAFSVSASGLIAYRSGSLTTRQLVWYDRSGRMLGTWGDPDADAPSGPEISPDGRQVLIWRTIQGNQDIWMLDANGRRTRLTLDAGYDALAVWSPGGNQIAFGSNRRGGFDLFKKPAVGTGGEELLFDGGGGEIPDNWSRDGRFLLYFVQQPNGKPDVWALPMVGEKKPIPIANSAAADERMSEFSPDGRWVAYQSDEAGGRFEIYVKPFPPRPGQWTVSKGGGSQVRWSRDGKELYYISLDGKMMAVQITVKGESIEAATPIGLFPTRIWGGGGANTTNRQQYDVSADGRFLIDTSIDENLSPITVVLNWKPPK